MKENINSLFKNVKNRLEDLRDLKTFIEYPNHIQDVYNPSKKWIVLIVFDGIMANMISNKNLSSIVTEQFIRGTKLNISTVFIAQPYFKVSKDVRLNCTKYKNSKQRRASRNLKALTTLWIFTKNVLQNHTFS